MDIIKNVIKKQKRDEAFLIGMDGLGGAGKTTFAEKLKRNLEFNGFHVVLLHMDDFIHPQKIRYSAKQDEWICYYDKQWRYDYVIENILYPIHLGETIDQNIEIYDKKNDTYEKRHVSIGSNTIVMLEGVFIQRPELKMFFDFVVYMDVPKDKRLERVLLRDTYIGDRIKIQEKYEKRYFPAEDFYMKSCSPIANADYVMECR